MIKTFNPTLVTIAAIAVGLSGCSGVPTAGPRTTGYVQDSVGTVKSGTGNCVRTGYWTPALAIAECDSDLVPRAAAPAAPPKPAPAPKPAAKPAAAAPAPAPKPAAKPAAVAPVTQKVTLAADVLFDFDKSAVKPEGKAKLDELVGKLKAINLEVIIAIGHTDSIGSNQYNQKLSMRRAQSVKDYMVSKGIQANRIYTEGKGEKQPVAPNTTKEGRQKNRRVEVEVVGTTTAAAKPAAPAAKPAAPAAKPAAAAAKPAAR